MLGRREERQKQISIRKTSKVFAHFRDHSTLSAEVVAIVKLIY